MTVLSNIIKSTWKAGQLQKDWKIAVLMPLMKKNKAKSDHPATEPTSLTSYIGTLVERIIIERLNWCLEHNHIITQCQAGFRSSYTTENQLNILTQEIQNGLQMNKDTIAVFVDLEKSYDEVGRQGLFIKMRDVGMYSNMYRRIKSLITARTIATQTESHKQNSASRKGYRKGAHKAALSTRCTSMTL